jgi:hypothetical protein
LSENNAEKKIYALIEILKNIANLWQISLIMHRDLLRLFSYTMTVRGIKFLIEQFEDNQFLNDVCVKFIKHPYPNLCIDAMNILYSENALTLYNLNIAFTKEHPEISASTLTLLNKHGLYENYHQSFNFDENAQTELSILQIINDSHLMNEPNIILFLQHRNKFPRLTDTFRIFFKYGLLEAEYSNQLYSMLLEYPNDYYLACAVYELRFFIYDNVEELKEIIFNTLEYHDGHELLNIISILKITELFTPEKYLELIKYEKAFELAESILNLVNCDLYSDELFSDLTLEANPKYITLNLALLCKHRVYKPNHSHLIFNHPDQTQLYQLLELLVQNKLLKQAEIKKIIHKLITSPHPFKLKQILSMVFEQHMFEKKQIPQLLKKLLKLSDLDSITKSLELFFHNSTFFLDEHKTKNFLSIIYHPNIKQLSSALLQINIQEIFQGQHAQFFYDCIMQHSQPKAAIVILQCLNLINRLDDLDLFQQISDHQYPIEYAESLVCFHKCCLMNTDNLVELKRFSNGYGLNILLRFLVSSKSMTMTNVCEIYKYQEILLDKKLILLWDEIEPKLLDDKDIHSILQICSQEFSHEEKINLIWKIIALKIPMLNSSNIPYQYIPINNVNGSASITLITLLKLYQQSLEEHSFYELISNFKSHLECFAEDFIKLSIAKRQLLDIYLNYCNYYDTNTHVTTVHLIGLISLALEDCYDLSGCVNDLIHTLNDIHEELTEEPPKIRVLALFNKLGLCLNNHHQNYEQLYFKKKFTSLRAQAIIESEVSKFCEQHHVLDFKMKTYWPQLRTQIEDSFNVEFYDFFSKTKIKQLALGFDRRFHILATVSVFAGARSYTNESSPSLSLLS